MTCSTTFSALSLVQALARGEDDILAFIRTISQRKFTVEEAKQAKEVFMVGSNTMVGLPGTALGSFPAAVLFSNQTADVAATGPRHQWRDASHRRC